MNEEKKLEPLFCDIKRQGEWSEEDAKVLADCGFILVFVPDPKTR